MKRTLLVLSAFAAFAVASVGIVSAANPHFIGTPSIEQDSNSLVVEFSAAGLGNAEGATFNLDGTVDVFSRCYNRGGNKPQADNKQETIAVSEQETFPVRNGRTNGEFIITPLSTLDCPGNQIVVIESVEYDLTLSGEGLEFHFTSD